MAKILVCGGLLIDRYILVDRFPGRGGDGYITDNFDTVGGCAVNMAKTIKALGAEPVVVSFVGNDRQGDEILGFMQKERFPMDCIRRTDGNTGYCFVFLEPDGERTFLTYKGCETEYSDSLIPDDPGDPFSVAAVTGYFLLDATSRGLSGRLKTLKADGCRIVFDPSPLVDKIDGDCLTEILSISDVLTPSITEAAFLAEFSGESSAEQWAYSLNKKGAAVIITQGGAGGALYENGKKTLYPAASVNVTDTTGAGDGFTGAIAYSLVRGMPLENGVVIAASVAGSVVSVKGPHV